MIPPYLCFLLLKPNKHIAIMDFVIPHLLFFLLTLLLPVPLVAQNNGTVRVGDSLIAGENSAWWLSPSEDFAFGFQPLDNGHFSLSIWYHKIQEKTTVWYANGYDNPAPRQSKLEVTADRGLLLTSPQGDPLWRSEVETYGSGIAYGVMNDTGNFVLLHQNSSIIWESFKHPTDTLLPTQTMEIDGVLSSRLRTKSSPVRFVFRFLSTGIVVLDAMNLQDTYPYNRYYESGTGNEANESNFGDRLIFDA